MPGPYNYNSPDYEAIVARLLGGAGNDPDMLDDLDGMDLYFHDRDMDVSPGTLKKIEGLSLGMGFVEFETLVPASEPEVKVEGDPLFALQEIMQPNEERRREMLGIIDEAAEADVRFFMGESEKQTGVLEKAATYKWICAAEIGERLPDSLVPYDQSSIMSAPHFYTNTPALDTAFNRLKGELDAPPQYQVQALVREHIKSSPGYALLRAFEQTPMSAQETLLTPQAYQRRTAQIAAGICMQYAISAEELLRYPAARQAYQLSITRLQTETMHVRQQFDVATDGCIERVRTYFAKILTECCRTEYPEGVFSGKAADIKSTTLALGSCMYGDRYLGPKTLLAVAAKINGNIWNTPANKYLSARMISAFSEISNEGWAQDTDLDMTVRDMSSLLTGTSQRGSGSSNCILAWMRETPIADEGFQAQTLASLDVYGGSLSRHKRPTPSFVHHEAMEDARSIEVGILLVDQRTEQEREVTVSRMIIMGPQISDLPEYAVIPISLSVGFNETTYAGLFGNGMPHIYGYKTVAYREEANGRIFDFARDEYDDPYRYCSIDVNQIQQQALALYSAKNDHMAIAMAIGVWQKLKIGDLPRIVAMQSDYYTPETAEEATRLSHLSQPPVKDGRIQLQCVPAQKLLVDMLEQNITKGGARIVGGLRLPDAEGSITLAAHTQTVFMHGNNLFVLDATPTKQSSGPVALPDSPASTARSNMPDVLSKNNQKKEASSAPQATASEPIHLQRAYRQAASAERAMNETRIAFMVAARQRLGLPQTATDEIVSKAITSVLKQRPRDILGEVAKHVFQAAPHFTTPPRDMSIEILNGKIIALEQTQDYLRKAAAASADKRSQAGLGAYNPTIIGSFQDTINALAGYYRQLIGAKEMQAYTRESTQTSNHAA